MAFRHGKNTHFSIDQSGSLADISQYCDTVSGLPGAADLSDVTGFGAGGHKYIVGLENTTFTVSGSWDDTTSTGVHAVMNAVRSAGVTSTFEFGPAGSGSGAIKFSGECWMRGYTVDAQVADKIPFSCEFQVDGIVTIGTFA